MEKDKRIIGKVLNVYDAQGAEEYIGNKGFFLNDNFYLGNLDNSAGIRVGTLTDVEPYTNYAPYVVDGSTCTYSLFIPESHVNTILRPCSNEKYETTNEDTLTWFSLVGDNYFDDIVAYGDLIYKYHVMSKQMLIVESNSNHVWCNFTVRDWRELHQKEY